MCLARSSIDSVDTDWSQLTGLSLSDAECPYPNREHCHTPRDTQRRDAAAKEAHAFDVRAGHVTKSCATFKGTTARMCLIRMKSNFWKVATGWRDVIVMNIGVHYNSAESYRKIVRDRLRAVRAWRRFHPLRRFVWRETAPQHFRTPDGGYDKNASRGCLPTLDADASSAQNWRNDLALRELRRAGLGGDVLRIWDHGLALGSAHYGASALARRNDCTHWCAGGPMPNHWNVLLYNYLANYLLA